MSKLTGNEPAYPCESNLAAAISGFNGTITYTGIPIRLHLAAQMMQGMLAHPVRYKPHNPRCPWMERISNEALNLADYLIAAYDKEPAHD